MSELKRMKMVGWYDPVQLARTGVEVVVSAMFGKHADRRLIQAIADSGSLKDRLYHEIERDGDDGEFWFDYVSDTGDGFDSTYSVAYHVTRPDLDLGTKGSPSVKHATKRGQLLVFGGDEVYPTAGAQAYKDRLVDLYDAAFPRKTRTNLKDPEVKCPPVFAIPGNHDWYDSLAEFMNLFCRSRGFCGWRTHQNRSYFAVKLPRGWWLFGTDMQLSSSLDDAQMDFFKAIVEKHMRPDERIIVCHAEPYWITDKMYRDDPNYNNRNLGYFTGHILNHRAVVHVAGDRHYYRRHEEISDNGEPVAPASKSKQQRFVAGGGGAFLHPTHREGVEEVGRTHLFQLKASYPDEKTSARMTLGNALFPIRNWKFGILTGILYVLTAQAFRADLSGYGLSEIGAAVSAVVRDFFYEPIATFWVVLLFAAFYLFTDTHTRYLRFFAGPVHALAHLVGVFALGWAAAYWFSGMGSWLRIVLSVFLLFGGGWLLGSLIMGVYLLVSLNVFGIHHNEAFSSLKIDSHKNFLRFRIDSDGTLTIFPVGIEQPIRKWKKGDKSTKVVPEAEPLPEENRPFLIEEPIRFVKPVRAPERAAGLEAVWQDAVPAVHGVTARKVTI